MFIERAGKEKVLPRSSGAKLKHVSRTSAGNIALRWSAGRAVTSAFYKHSAPLEPGALSGDTPPILFVGTAGALARPMRKLAQVSS
jgi:hypothetical protein